MSRYICFAWDDFYAGGGINDCIGISDNFDEIVNIAQSHPNHWHHHVCDIVERKVIIIFSLKLEFFERYNTEEKPAIKTVIEDAGHMKDRISRGEIKGVRDVVVYDADSKIFIEI